MTIHAVLELEAPVWMDIPPFWGEPSWKDEHEWAAEGARIWWNASGLPHGDVDVDRLAAVLVGLATKWGPGSVHPEHAADPGMDIHTFLYLPDPRELPMPVRVFVVRPQNPDDDLELRDLVIADDPTAVDVPEIAEVENPHLGTGLSAFRLREFKPESEMGEGALYAVLRYAFPVPDHPDRVVLTASWPDLARVTAARDEIDKLARSITYLEQPDN